MNIIQLLLILVYAAVYMFDYWDSQLLSFAGVPIMNGFVVGLIMGDPVVGLKIGATLQLMQLGGAGYGGASAPEYDVGAMIGTIVAAITGKGMNYGLAIGLPVSLLMIQVDVIIKMICTFFIQRSRKHAESSQFKAAYAWLIGGLFPWLIKAMIPVLLLFIVGSENVKNFVDVIPDWITGSFAVAGGLLPAVGIAILMKYMNFKEYFVYVIIGFALVSYFALPMMGIAILGFCMAMVMFKQEQKGKSVQHVTAGGLEDEL